ncbi:MAG: DUF1834 family protein [Nitrospirae bacterium]|nr:DUF1834 family protein [Nitrospirota bacterium]
MSTEIDQTEDLIITAIKIAAPEFRIVDTWPDKMDLDTLLEEMLQTPACYVISAGVKYGEKKTIGANNSDDEMTFRLTIVVENLRTRQDGIRGAYALIDAVKTKLKGMNVAPLRGFLWPVTVELIAVKNQYFAYGMEFVRKVNS